MLRIYLLAAAWLLAVAPCYAQSFSKQTFHTARAKSPGAGTIFIYPERIPLKAGGFFNAERGMMFVPLNRALGNGNSDVIAIDFYRFRRGDQAAASTPPIFFLHGGPGWKGLESELGRRGNFEQRWQPLIDVSDVVVVGQRGIGSSKPNTVIDQTIEQSADTPYDPQTMARELQAKLSQERRVWEEELGVDLQGFNVVEAAADVDDLRQALGYDKITIWGGSFGSHWGMTIMRKFPHGVARAVLWGMEGPDHTYDHPGWVWKTYARIAADAESSPELREHIPEGGLIKAVEALVEQATKEPFTVSVQRGGNTVDVLFDGKLMRRMARGYSGNIRAWPAEIIKMHRGDFDSAARRAAFQTTSRGRDLRTASYWMLDCGSGITAKRLAEFEADPAHQVIGSTYWYYEAGCPAWDSDLGDEFRQNFETDIPTLIVHGTWDTSTPLENALELAPFFNNSKFIQLKRGPHGALGAAALAHPEFRLQMLKFVVTGDLSQLPDELELPPVKWVVPD